MVEHKVKADIIVKFLSDKMITHLLLVKGISYNRSLKNVNETNKDEILLFMDTSSGYENSQHPYKILNKNYFLINRMRDKVFKYIAEARNII